MLRSTEPITWSVDDLRAAVQEAPILPLLAALAHATGDLTLLRPELRPDPDRLGEPDSGLTPDQLREARRLALDALVRLRDGVPVVRDEPLAEILAEIMEFTVGVADMAAYVPLLREELAVAGADLRAPRWRADEVAPGRRFTVAVIGAGMSGLAAAYRLRQAGVDVVILEKNDDVGGTWLDNTYPGCRVDVANHVYCYSFAQEHDWPQYFSTQDVLLDYFRRCADDLGLRELVRFGTEVCELRWDDDRAVWVLDLATAEGADRLEVEAVISAVGQLSRPALPDIDGRDSFAGPAFHSARWDHEADLAGKRVAVIGTGASAAQFVPHVADRAEEVLVFQRTPPWLIPTPEYHDDVPDGMRYLLTHVPFYSQWHRFFLFWISAEGGLPRVRVDPAWEPKDRSVSAANDEMRALLTMYLEHVFAGSPELLDAVVPTYPPGAKRVIRDNGIWAATLQRDHVHLVTTPIDRITPSGIVTADGTGHDVDVIIYGTGFSASSFLTPMRVVGRGGVDLHERWGPDARAHLGICVPGFPNLFLLYGPNTNIVINGSIIFFSECEVHYVTECLRLLFERDARALDCRAEVHDAYVARVDAGNALMAWGASDVSSWYKSPSGRIAQNWPFTLLEYWQQTRTVDPDDYELL